MITVLYGNDVVAVRKKAEAFLRTALEKRGQDTTIERIDADRYETGIVRDLLESESLFGGETVVVLDTPSDTADFASEVDDVLAEIGESAKQFLVIEGPLLAAAKKKFQKHTDDITEHKAAAAERFNAFGMADALARRDKKSLWVLLQQAVAAGLSSEEIIGTLWWQLKAVRLALQTNTPAEAGMKDYPYKKAKAALQKFTQKEIIALSTSLLAVYHDGHAGKRSIDLALEEWVLRV